MDGLGIDLVDDEFNDPINPLLVKFTSFESLQVSSLQFSELEVWKRSVHLDSE